MARRGDKIQINKKSHCEEVSDVAILRLGDLFFTYVQRNEVTVLRDYKLTMQLKELQQLVDEWIKTVGVRYFDELTNLGQLVEEVGELSRIMIRTYGEQSVKEGKELGDLGDELADILFVLACIANQTGVDLNHAFEKNMSEKKNGRDLLRHVSNEKLNKG